MFPRPQRLRSERDITALHRLGRKGSNAFLRLLYRPNGLEHHRTTVVVSQRVAKRAVDRNRLKRQLRPMLRQLLQRFALPHDIMVYVQPPARQTDPAHLHEALTSLFERHHLYD